VRPKRGIRELAQGKCLGNSPVSFVNSYDLVDYPVCNTRGEHVG
jgi:hypothetical protein